MKQFGILGDLKPFEPANPALDIPDGSELELKKVTDQSMNAFYGELASSIINSGQNLTPTNGTNPNPEQLWQAISSNSFKGNLFIDAGGSTAQIRNLKAANPNTYLPPAVGGAPASLATKNQWVGFCFTMENAQNAAYDTTLTINFKDKNGATVMSTTYHQPLAPLLSIPGNAWLDCIIINNVNKEVQPRYSYPPATKIFESLLESVEISNYRPEGKRITTFRSSINTATASTTEWNVFNFPVAFAEHPSVFCQIIDNNSSAAGQATGIVRAAFITVAESDVPGQGFKYIGFNQNGTRAADLSFSIIAHGYS